jgi:hypothetical protein
MKHRNEEMNLKIKLMTVMYHVTFLAIRNFKFDSAPAPPLQILDTIVRLKQKTSKLLNSFLFDASISISFKVVEQLISAVCTVQNEDQSYFKDCETINYCNPIAEKALIFT